MMSTLLKDVFDDAGPVLSQCMTNVTDARHTLRQRWTNEGQIKIRRSFVLVSMLYGYLLCYMDIFYAAWKSQSICFCQRGQVSHKSPFYHKQLPFDKSRVESLSAEM